MGGGVDPEGATINGTASAARSEASSASRLSTAVATPKKAGSGADATLLKRFEMVFKKIQTELLDDLEELQTVDKSIVVELRDYYRRLLDHTCLGGKMVRGLTVVKAATFAMVLSPGAELDDETWEKAAILGWCVELMQAFFLVADDVMDSSHTRRGLPCWYRLPEVTSSNAINDALFIDCAISRTLERHFRSHPHFNRLSTLLQFAQRMTVLGQHIDTNAQPVNEKKTRLDRFTPQRYSAQVRQKTAYYSFFLPCALGLVLAGKTEKKLEEQVMAVCLEMGEYFQAQDDFLDCYAHPDLLGKVGTDIQEGKCTWLVVNVLPLLTEAERQELQDNYGRDDEGCVAAVKTIYKRHGIEAAYCGFEEKSHQRCSRMIENVDDAAGRQVLRFLLGRIYGRRR